MKDQKNKDPHGFLYNHSEVFSGLIFFIIVFVGMAVASHYLK